MAKVVLQLEKKKHGKIYLFTSIFIALFVLYTMFKLAYLIHDYKKELNYFNSNSEHLNSLENDRAPLVTQKAKIDLYPLDILMQARTAQTNYNHIQYAVNKELIVDGNTKKASDVNLIVSSALVQQLHLKISQVQSDSEHQVNFELKQVLK
ncbi:hypothetical protein [Acinetobacter bereziniae]|uniref:hypothetical protein n=1 Tax=Acinetobacter bereziniae TaxID=106648 RepID=UPI00125FFD66|nr:hypothetical protein [Acinetobacter bereziniae]